MHACRSSRTYKQPEPRWAIALLAITLLFASSCALLPQPAIQPPTESTPPVESGHKPKAATAYQVTTASLEIHTFKAGWLAGLAHNHVMETAEVQGTIYLIEPVDQSTARLYFRPWDLQLDDPSSRARAGAGFESERSAADVAATRTRMLGPSGFDSNEHPWVIVDVRWRDAVQVALQIGFRGDTYAFDVPMTWSIQAQEISAKADFELSHRALGIRPYSAFAGAIAVADPIRVQLTLSARPASSL